MANILNLVVIVSLVLQGVFQLPYSFSNIKQREEEINVETSQNKPTYSNDVPILADQIREENAALAADNTEGVRLRLTAEPQLANPGETATISWNISAWPKISNGPGTKLQFFLPIGVDTEEYEGVENADGQMIEIPLAAPKGSMHVTLGQNVELPFVIDAVLMVSDESIYTNYILLDRPHYRSTAAKASTISAKNGKVKVSVPAGAATEDLLVDVRDAGPDSERGYSLSGYPIEIVAVGSNTKKNIDKFNEEITISIQYDPENIYDWAEDDLKIFYFDEETMDWWPVATAVDKTTHTLTANVDHMTVFDYKAESWQRSRPPTVEAAQVSAQTGAATYQMEFWTPPAPGGLQPQLALTYNSQVIDNSTAFVQASWVGMGWSLDTGYIERNMHGTDNTLTDDTYSLSLNGVSMPLLPIETVGNITRYATEEINYSTIEHDSSTGNWTIWDQSGTRYQFNDQAKTHTTNACVTSTANLDLPWRWSLTAVTDKFGNTLSYSYTQQPKSTTCVNRVAVYPDTITYPNNMYRIVFVRENRLDYQAAWEANDSTVFFANQRLERIQVQQYVNGAWTTTRQYDFSYSAGSTDQIHPGFAWTMGAKTTSLVGVQELNAAGAGLPSTTFKYEDSMHLTKVNNGQGGTVAFEYARWHYLDETNKAIRHILTEFGSPSQDCEADGPSQTWTAMAGYGTVKCEASMLQIDSWSDPIGVGLRTFPEHMVKLGGQYRLFIQARNIYATTGIEWGFTGTNGYGDIQGSVSGVGQDYIYQEFGGEMPVNFDPKTTKLIIECDNCYVKKIDFAFLQLFYRVTTKTVHDSATNSDSIYTYNYDEPAVNDTYHSEAANKTTDLTKFYTPLVRDYRGHAMSLVTNPDGLLTTNWYYQNDLLSGKAYRTLESTKDFYDPFDALSTANWTYSHQNTRQTLPFMNYDDNALLNTNPGADWTSVVNRNGYTLQNGDFMYAQFKAEGANVQNEMGITDSAGNFFGLVVQPGGSGKVIQLRTRIAGVQSDSTILIPDSTYKVGAWYMMVIFVDANDNFRIRLWEKRAPQNYGEANNGSLNGGAAWKFIQKTYNGSVYLDTYLEGIPLTETRTFYSASMLYDTDPATPAPNLANTGLLTFVDLSVNQVFLSETVSRIYDGDYSWSGTHTILCL